MRYSILLFIIIALALTGCLPTEKNAAALKPTAPASYPDLGPAPELANKIWLNTAAPLRLADLRGKVVLIELWTFG
jgi:hypothetical protein